MPRAAAFLVRCLRDAPEPASPEARARHELRVLDLARARRAVGALTFRVPAGADLTIDGRPVGRAPLDHDVFVTPGSHRVRAERGDHVGEAVVEIAAGDQRRVAIELAASAPAGPRAAPRAGPRGWIIVAGATSSAALLVLGTGLQVAAGAAESDADRVLASRPNGCFSATAFRCPGLLDAYETIALARDLGSGALVAGGALAAGTVTYALFPRQAGPKLTLTGTGMRVEGSW